MGASETQNKGDRINIGDVNSYIGYMGKIGAVALLRLSKSGLKVCSGGGYTAISYFVELGCNKKSRHGRRWQCAMLDTDIQNSS